MSQHTIEKEVDGMVYTVEFEHTLEVESDWYNDREGGLDIQSIEDMQGNDRMDLYDQAVDWCERYLSERSDV